MKMLYIVRGAPGTGKSTISREIREKHERHGEKVGIAEADQCFKYACEHAEPGTPFPKTMYDPCINYARKLFSEGCDVVIANGILCELREVDQFVKLAIEEESCYVVYRMDTRYDNTHGVPESDVDKFFKMMKPYPGETVFN